MKPKRVWTRVDFSADYSDFGNVKYALTQLHRYEYIEWLGFEAAHMPHRWRLLAKGKRAARNLPPAREQLESAGYPVDQHRRDELMQGVRYEDDPRLASRSDGRVRRVIRKPSAEISGQSSALDF